MGEERLEDVGEGLDLFQLEAEDSLKEYGFVEGVDGREGLRGRQVCGGIEDGWAVGEDSAR